MAEQLEKLSVEEFRELKKEVKDHVYGTDPFTFTKLHPDFFRRYEEIINILTSHDLSDIPFEEWKGMLFDSANHRVSFDFSKTNANLDFRLIDYNIDYMLFDPPIVFKSCNVRNFDFKNESYDEDTFDEKVIDENPEFFIKGSQEYISRAFYEKRIKLPDYIYNLSDFEGKNVKGRFSHVNGKCDDVIELCGDDLYEMCKKYGKFFILMTEENHTVYFDLKYERGFHEYTEKERKKIISKALKDYLEQVNDHPNLDFKLLTEFIKIEDLPDLQSDDTQDFIEKMGAENILKFDIETNGCLSRRCEIEEKNQFSWQRLINRFATFDKRFLQKKPSNYEEFKEIMYNLLLKQIDARLFNQDDWDFIKGEFREEHPDIFLDYPKESVKARFYRGTLDGELVRSYPDLLQALRGKRLEYIFRSCIRTPEEIDNRTIYLSENERISKFVKNIGEYNLLQMFYDYGECIDYAGIIVPENYTIDSIREDIEKRIYEIITNHGIRYYDDMPESFKKKYPELFLPETVDERLRQLYCQNELSYQDIREHPELAEILKNYRIRLNGYYGFNNFNRELMLICKTQEELLEFAKDYGKYLTSFLLTDKVIEALKAKGLTSRQIVENEIEKAILTRKVENSENAPDFFKKKYPDMFLSPDAPDELKELFYSGTMKLVNINEHPEWIPFLKDKNLKYAFLKDYTSKGVFEYFSNEEFFKLCTKFFDEFRLAMYENNDNDSVKKLHEWFSALGGKWLPNYLIIKIFPTDDIDRFLENSKKWSYITRKANFKDETSIIKGDILKLAYSFGVFHGNDNGYKKVLEIIKQRNDIHQIFNSFKMIYNPDFVNFVLANYDELLNNEDNASILCSIQKDFKNIQKFYNGATVTVKKAFNYIERNKFSNVEVGNELLASLAKKVGYTQEDYDKLQKLYDEGKDREFSSIPRITGKAENGFTYEMLRLDDPIILVIGPITNCCQNINGAAKSTMEHSMISPDGRIFVVRDKEGRIVAQSWFWRNGYVGCFDNIEIPNKIFKIYRKKEDDDKGKDIAKEVLEVYKVASKHLMQEDKKAYDELLQKGVITNEEYQALVFGKITIGLGFNDIANAIQRDESLKEDKNIVFAKPTARLPKVYTDANTQYIVSKKDSLPKHIPESMPLYQDDIPVYDKSTIDYTIYETMRRMNDGKNKLQNGYTTIYYDEDQINIMDKIAETYELNPNTTKVIINSRMAIIYSTDGKKIKIGEIFTAPHEDQETERKVNRQLKKALKQIDADKLELDTSDLNSKQQEILQIQLNKIKQEQEREQEDKDKETR